MTWLSIRRIVATLAFLVLAGCGGGGAGSPEVVDSTPPPVAGPPPAPVRDPSPFVPREVPADNITIAEADCSIAKIGATIPITAIGEPVSAVILSTPTWVAAAGALPAYCRVNGSMSPIDSTAPLINFGVVLPASWAYRAVQLGGAGNNGTIPALTGAAYLGRGWMTTGSDSGHQSSDDQWSLSDESLKNMGYMQMKKTHDAAWAISERLYGRKPVYSYFIGGSQGGREAVTVAQRYANDYDGIVATVPVMSFSNATLSRALHRQKEIPLANWVTSAKVNAISAEVVRRCDGLDNLVDGVINNYQACRALFDVKRGDPKPWAAIRCPDNIDPNPADTTAAACLTDGQMSTMEFVHTPYRFATPMANGATHFGMWVPNTDPGGSGMILGNRVRGQEGAASDAPLYSWLGAAYIVGGLFKDLQANVLTYLEGGSHNARRLQLSEWFDATNPDLTPFYEKGGRLLVMVGTHDSLASSGAQLDYYESLLQTMGRNAVDQIARLWVMPGGNHGLGGTNYKLDGNGNTIPTSALPNTMDRTQMIVDWVETGVAPPMAPIVTGGGRAVPLCSYPQYPRYLGNDLPTTDASSYSCVE